MQFSWKKSLLKIFKILRLFVNTLSADDKYSLLNRDNLTEQFHILSSQKQKDFLGGIFFCIFEISIKFWRFSKKKWTSYLMYSRYYLQILKISRLFLNTLSADDKYSLLNRENLTQPIQIQFSQKEIIFSLIFLCICEIYIKFWTFSKIKDDTDSWCICESTEMRKRGYIIV